MTIDAINLICQKLGTTVENLIPTVIKYSIHQDRILGTVGIALVIFGVFLAIVAMLTKNNYTGDVSIGCIVIAAILVPVGIAMIIFSAVDIHMWNLYPQIKAYETILNWIGGS